VDRRQLVAADVEARRERYRKAARIFRAWNEGIPLTIRGLSKELGMKEDTAWRFLSCHRDLALELRVEIKTKRRIQKAGV
jgi:hypothetical protein